MLYRTIILLTLVINITINKNSIKMKSFTLTERKGEAPTVGATTPQLQFSDKSPEEIRVKLWDWAFSTFPKVRKETSKISVPTSQALWLHEDEEVANSDAFMPPAGGREFTHLHLDGSIHAVVSTEVENEVINKKWGVRHPLYYSHGVKEILVYAPRNEEEIKVLQAVIIKSYEYATGKTVNNQ